MKKFLVVLLIRVGVWPGFFMILGIPQALWHANDGGNSLYVNIYGVEVKRQQHTRDEEMKFSARMFNWQEEKTKQARAQIDRGGMYSSEEYFADFREYADSCRLFGSEPIGSPVSHLVGIAEYPKSQEELQKIREKYFPEMMAVEKASKSKSINWGDIGAWWLGIYLKTLPLALLLFLAWFYEETEYKKIRFRNPLSFIISLLLYPIVIGHNVARWWKAIGGEIEVRRSKGKIFSLLSNDEIALVKGFAKSNLSLKQFKQELKLRGYVPKYSFAAVLFAMVIMAFVPMTVLSKQVTHDERTRIYQTTTTYDYFSIDQGAVEVGDHYVADMELPWNWTVLDLVYLLQRVWNGYFVSLLCRGHYHELEHVPLSVKSFSNNF
jgi:hypothetical protein